MNSSATPTSCTAGVWSPDDERHAHELLVERLRMEVGTVLAEGLPVVAGHDDVGAVRKAVLELTKHPTEPLVGHCHLGEIALVVAAGLERAAIVGLVGLHHVGVGEEPLLAH